MALILTLLISVSYVSTVAQSSTTSGVCLMTAEGGEGQGRFSVGGMGRFSVGGMEGPDGALTIDDGLTQDEIDTILNNTINSDFLFNTVLAYPDLGSQKVVILVVDDFADSSPQQLTIGELLQFDGTGTIAEQIAEYYKGTLGTSDVVTATPHGETVMEVVQTLINDVKARYQEQGLTLDIVARPVDISSGGQYELSLLVPKLSAAIARAHEEGYNNVVVNMSFGFIPCFDSGTNFNFQTMMENRFNFESGLNDSIGFDVDGGVGPEGETPYPTFFSDFGVMQYLVNVLDFNIQDGAFQYFNYLFSQVDENDENIVAMRQLFQSYLAQAAESGGQYSFLPVASSGNYRDIFIANGKEPQPLAPARFPEIFAVSGTLGMDGRGWEYSQNGSIMLPGAWWKFEDGSYRAGTSYSAPYLSVIGALYLSSDNPPACDFSNGLPLAGDKMNWNNSVFTDGRLLCNPNPKDGIPNPTPTPTTETPTTTPTPDPTTETPTSTPTPDPTNAVTITELVINGGFEEFERPVAPDGWNVVKPSKDKVVCNKDKDGDGIIDKYFSRSGDCAWRFKGVAGERAKLIQRVDMTGYTLNSGDGVQLQIFANAKTTPRAVAKVKVQFLDGNKAVEKFRIPQTTGYQEFTSRRILDRTDVDFVKLIFIHKTPTGRLHLDDVSLKLYQTNALRDRSLVPIPELPGTMRD